MKRFILHSILFLFPVAAVLAGWELYMWHFPHIYKYKRTVIAEDCRRKGEIVFLGSSHAFFGVKTDILTGAYNLAYVSQSLRHDRFIFEYLVSKPHRLKYAAIPVSIFSFFANKKAEEEWRERNYVRYWGCPSGSFADNFFILDNIPQQLRYVQKYSKRFKRKNILQVFDISPTGWGNSYVKAGNISQFAADGKKTASRHCNVFLENTENFEFLKEIIKLAQQHNIKVILYTPPGHKTYTSCLSTQQEEKMRALIAKLSSEKGVFYLDLLRSETFTDDDFFDPDHLSGKGAEKMTRMLHSFYSSK